MHDYLSHFDVVSGAITLKDGTFAPSQKRYLSDLKGMFVDDTAYEAALARENSLVYEVASVTPAEGQGDLAYGLGRIMPGCVGSEFYLTKGHFHAWPAAAEWYIGLEGEGVMVLEDETRSQTRVVPLTPHSAVYVPGHTAHRTVNTGSSVLAYLGIYPAQAGHDYASLLDTPFQKCVVAANSDSHQSYHVIDRNTYQRQ